MKLSTSQRQIIIITNYVTHGSLINSHQDQNPLSYQSTSFSYHQLIKKEDFKTRPGGLIDAILYSRRQLLCTRGL